MPPITSQTAALGCPLGARIAPAELHRDPYAFFAAVREREPISWVSSLNMWFITRYADVRTILLDHRRFTTAHEQSPVFDTFGEQMLTTDGELHDRYRQAMRHAFLPRYVETHLEPRMQAAADRLVDTFVQEGRVELRSAFASRLPIQAILLTLGMPTRHEMAMRAWYDRFEPALANFTQDPRIRVEGQEAFGKFHEHMGAELRDLEREPKSGTFISDLVSSNAADRLSHDEIIRNLAIIFFGGISTVEALILNTLWAMLQHPGVLERVREDLSLVPAAVDETARWLSPVQSATRHAIEDCEFQGVRFRAGDTVSCMLGAANRDPRMFDEPERFDIDRANARAHLGFAAGPHHCLGFRLAQAQARIAIQTLLGRLPSFRLDGDHEGPEGYEFRQPRVLRLIW